MCGLRKEKAEFQWKMTMAMVVAQGWEGEMKKGKHVIDMKWWSGGGKEAQQQAQGVQGEKNNNVCTYFLYFQ